jgi:hypothetical protein
MQYMLIRLKRLSGRLEGLIWIKVGLLAESEVIVGVTAKLLECEQYNDFQNRYQIRFIYLKRKNSI